MKKIFVILLMLVYGISSSGMTVTLHYCCGKLDDISFSAKKGKSCPMGTFMKKTSCCKDTQVTAKIGADQNIAGEWLQASGQSIATLVQNASFVHPVEQIIPFNSLARGTPVPVTTIPLFIKNCVFRI